MKVLYKLITLKPIRLGFLLSLIFFVQVILPACGGNNEQKFTIIWQNNKATGINIPASLLPEGAGASTRRPEIRLKNNANPILGEYRLNGDFIIFEPLIAFSPGQNYEVRAGKKLLFSFGIPLPEATISTQLVSIYPTTDTVPENLLKLYFQFSAPMQEGNALTYIRLINENGDTLKDVFLDLQPELWNKDRTILTVWFDPGRIKRDLIPNLRLGSPLHKGQHYTLLVSNDWKDVYGLKLQKTYAKSFLVGSRDSLVPDPDRWIVEHPLPQSVQALKINFGEKLDYFLLQETIAIISEKGDRITGRIEIEAGEKSLHFYPDKKWVEGMYRLQVASHLEDLAGNNLNRLFDRDINVLVTEKEKRFFEKRFSIRQTSPRE